MKKLRVLVRPTSGEVVAGKQKGAFGCPYALAVKGVLADVLDEPPSATCGVTRGVF